MGSQLFSLCWFLYLHFVLKKTSPWLNMIVRACSRREIVPQNNFPSPRSSDEWGESDATLSNRIGEGLGVRLGEVSLIRERAIGIKGEGMNWTGED